MSCNGCRILRKGCSADCVLRPSLNWISSADAQANATLFLAKFYGRAGLLNLINAAASPPLRSEIFRSLLYEACGRIINPVYGSVGLMSSGNWSRCQAAVDAVFQGGPIAAAPAAAAAGDSSAVLSCDIRHLSKDSPGRPVTRTRTRKRRRVESSDSEAEMKFTITGWDYGGEDYDSASVETVEPALVNRVEYPVRAEPELLSLDLCLGPNPLRRAYGFTVVDISDSET
ncbi:LOB domain-containing protein 41-like [Andrographis paniculata]|uniref:LOB domain-containing protein 41-like n=1 Tax=Andrographis paniculata TaxID=175694 RepID=UPI0021E8A651|nr:LOB domain-containing protein 41-like [Andrographis paniculata]